MFIPSAIFAIPFFFFFFNDTATTEIYTLSLHDALPISHGARSSRRGRLPGAPLGDGRTRGVPGQSVREGRDLRSGYERLVRRNAAPRRARRSRRGRPHRSRLRVRGRGAAPDLQRDGDVRDRGHPLDRQGADANPAPRRGRRRDRQPDLRRRRRDPAGLGPHRRERGLHAVTAPALALVLLLAVSITPVAGAGEPTREEALRALAGAADAEARRQAARALGERGAMEDIPRLARGVRDRSGEGRGGERGRSRWSPYH